MNSECHNQTGAFSIENWMCSVWNQWTPFSKFLKSWVHSFFSFVFCFTDGLDTNKWVPVKLPLNARLGILLLQGFRLTAGHWPTREGGGRWKRMGGGRSILTWHYLWLLGPLEPASGMTISTFLAFWCPQGRSNSCSTSGRPVWLGHSLNTNMRDHPIGVWGCARSQYFNL